MGIGGNDIVSVCYQNGDKIEKLRINELNTLSMLISQNNCRLSAKNLTDIGAWADIYMAWIAVCVDYMWFVGHGKNKMEEKAPKTEQVRVIKLFQDGAKEEERVEFLDSYRKMLTKPGYPNVGKLFMAEKICADIDRQIPDMASYMRLRVKAVCLLANSAPENIFTEGAGWNDVISAPVLSATYEAGTINVADKMCFEIEPDAGFDSGIQLTAKTLRNKSNTICRIQIQWRGENYFVKLPPYGFLRAVFADSGHAKLVSLKGSISCCDTDYAIIQMGDEAGNKLYHAHHVGDIASLIEIPSSGLFWDAAADEKDGVTGAVILTVNELRSTVNRGRRLLRGDGISVPIRCYRSGNQWAWLYEEGRLESNLLRNGADMEGVTAVAEDAERGLLVCCQGQFWDYRGIVRKEISEDEFIEAMLRRFSQAGSDECEVQVTENRRWAIHDSGEVK